MTEPTRRTPRRQASKESQLRVTDPDRLRDARMAKGWSYRQLGGLCHKSHNAIYLLENGKLPRVSPRFARDLCNSLGIRLEEAFEDTVDVVVTRVESTPRTASTTAVIT